MSRAMFRPFLTGFAMLLVAGLAMGATLTVDSDTDDGTGCTLREAVASANGDSAVGGCAAGSGSDTIVFDGSLAGSTITLTSNDDTSFGPSALEVSSNVTIEGPDDGPGITITRSGPGRLIYVTGGGDLTVRDLTLTGGTATGFDGGPRSRGGGGGGGAGMGGAIFNEGEVHLVRSTLSGNTAVGGEGGAEREFNQPPDGSFGGGGAGVAGDGAFGGDSPGAGGAGGGGTGGSGGEDCTDGFGGSFGSGGGGGGADTNGDPGCDGGTGGLGGGGGGGGSGALGKGSGGGGGFGGGAGGDGGVESIIPGGAGGGGAGLGGAIFNHDGLVTVTNSTLSGNSAVGGPGGTAVIGSGGGEDGQGLGAAIFNYSGMLFILNSTLYDNDVDGSPGSEGAVVSRGDGGAANDLIDNSILAGTRDGGAVVADYVSSTNAGFGGTNNYIETTSAGFPNPVTPATEGIGGLADNGGPTFTHELTAASDLIDQGDVAVAGGLTTDQRGYIPRDTGGIPDVGAYEFGASPPNSPPVADAGPDQTVECSAPMGGTEVTLDGSGSSDPDDDPLTYTWTGPFPQGGGTVTGVMPVVTLPLGVHVITLEVDDGNGEQDTDTVQITVEDTTPPDITLNGDNPMVLECAIDSYDEPGAVVTDICDDDPMLDITGTVDTATPGTYPITYTATDASSNMAQEIRDVFVVDTTPPVITVLPSPIVLWPPNHKYVGVSVADIVTSVVDLCDTGVGIGDVVVTSVSSDEVENGKGDGNTLNDIVIADDCRSVNLRSERSGRSNGRVYTIHLAATDADGNTGTASFQVQVPHSLGSGPAVDDGPVYTEVSACGGA